MTIDLTVVLATFGIMPLVRVRPWCSRVGKHVSDMKMSYPGVIDELHAPLAHTESSGETV